MARTRLIPLALNASCDVVLDRIHSLVAERGDTWEPTGPVSARIHQGKRLVRQPRMTTRLLTDVDISESHVRLTRRSDGLGLVTTPLGALPLIRITRRFRRLHRELATELRRAGLVASGE